MDLAVGGLDLDVGNGRRFFAGTEGVLAVVGDFKTRNAGRRESMHERGQRAVAFANYSEHALGSGEAAAAIAYIQIKTADGKVRWGAGVDTNIAFASVRALLSALNRW